MNFISMFYGSSFFIVRFFSRENCCGTLVFRKYFLSNCFVSFYSFSSSVRNVIFDSSLIKVSVTMQLRSVVYFNIYFCFFNLFSYMYYNIFTLKGFFVMFLVTFVLWNRLFYVPLFMSDHKLWSSKSILKGNFKRKTLNSFCLCRS